MDLIHSAIHQNLVLLTKVFPNLDMESKLQQGMFKRPSTKGMQSVFYSLMYIINPEYCRKCVPWPVAFSSDNFKFRTSIIEFINKDCPGFEVPALLPSLLNKVDGEKYVKFVFNFVAYITQKVLKMKFGKITLQKPHSAFHYEENLKLLDDVIVSNLADYDEKVLQRKNFIEKSNILMNSSVNELQTKLKDYQTERQSVYAEMKDALSYTNVTEETVLDGIFSSYEDEIMELKYHLNSLKETVKSKLERKEYLLRLIKLKQKMRSSLFDVNAFRPFVNENLAEQIQVPLPVLSSTLFLDREDTCEIHLINFLMYGRRAIQIQMRRALKLSPTDQQLAVYQTVDSLALSTIKRLEMFRTLRTKLDIVVKDCEREGLQIGVSTCDESDQDWVNLFLTLKSHDNYAPKFNVSVAEKPLIIGFCAIEGNTDPVARMKKRLQLVGREIEIS